MLLKQDKKLKSHQQNKKTYEGIDIFANFWRNIFKEVKFSKQFFSKKIFIKLVVFTLIFSWLFSGWPPIWQNPRVPFETEEVFALNKTNNWNFNGNSTGWTSTDGTSSGSSTACNGTDATEYTFLTFIYSSSMGGQTAFAAGTPATKNKNYRGMIYQTVTAPGSGTVKAKGKFSYYGTGTGWGTGMVSLEIWDSGNTTRIANLGCALMTASTSWTTTSFSSDVSLTGGTNYTIRVNFNVRNSSAAGTSIAVDNIVVNFAPTGLSASAPAGTTNAQLNWTTSTAGTGANGLHATTPYKVYRDGASPVSTFLANSTTNSYTDSSTTGNTTYYYSVTDYDTASEESPLSAEASILTRPGAPTSLNFTNVQGTSLRLNWTAPTGGATSYRVERCSGTGCTNFSEIASGVTNAYYDDSGLTCGGTIYRYQVRSTNASGEGPYSAATSDQATGSCGSLSADIVDASYVTVSSPTMAMSSATFSFSCQTITGSFGTASQQIYVNNNDAADNGWTLTVAAQATTNVWDSAGTDYDFNDPGTGTGCTDHATDADAVGGQMTIDPSVATLAIGQCGSCTLTGVSKGSSAAFDEVAGTPVNSITLLSATSASDDIGDWTLQGVSISQKIPTEQPVASDYDINMVLTITAN